LFFGSEFNYFKGEICLDDFYRTRTLASGNFGRVLLVQHKWNKQFYAMKVLEKQKVFSFIHFLVKGAKTNVCNWAHISGGEEETGRTHIG
jgi:hypothetical protein